MAGIIKMKKELDKKIKQICDEVGGAAAEAKLDDVTRIMNDQYDKIIESGKSELDAYRAILSDTEKIREMFNSIPKSEQKRKVQGEREKSSGKKKNKKEILTLADFTLKSNLYIHICMCMSNNNILISIFKQVIMYQIFNAIFLNDIRSFVA